MLLEASPDQIPFHRRLDTFRFCDFYVVNKTFPILGKTPLPATNLLTITLFNFLKECVVSTNGYCLYKFQLHDTRLDIIKFAR